MKLKRTAEFKPATNAGAIEVYRWHPIKGRPYRFDLIPLSDCVLLAFHSLPGKNVTGCSNYREYSTIGSAKDGAVMWWDTFTREMADRRIGL